MTRVRARANPSKSLLGIRPGVSPIDDSLACLIPHWNGVLLMLTFSLSSLLAEVEGAPSALRRVLDWKFECFPLGCRKHFEWIF